MRKKIKTYRLKLTILNTAGVLILFHISRDVCQFFNWETFWAEWAHGFGVNLSNQVLRLFHLTYQRWQEVPFVAAEVWAMKAVAVTKKRIKDRAGD